MGQIFRVSLLGGVALLGIMAAPALAQDASPMVDQSGPDEIIVTAQKRVQNVQNVGASISALNSEVANSINTAGIASLASQLPSLQVSNYSPTITIFNLRGVSQNDFADSQESPVAFYVDEVYISAMGAIAGQMYDLERIEVLRGPQGTLFGRNATGGLIQAVTAKPSDTLDGHASLTIGSYDQVTGEVAVGGPLTEGLRGRAAIVVNRQGGYIDNATGPSLGNQRNWGARLQLAADVGSSGTINLKYQFLRNDHERNGGLYSHKAAIPNEFGLGEYVDPNENPYDTCNGCDVFGYRQEGGPFDVAFNGPNFFDRKYHDVTLRYEQEFGGATLVSITDYQNLKKAYGEDADLSPAPIFAYTTSQDLEQYSQELRLSGDTGRLNWLVGAYAIKIDSLNGYNTDLSGIGLNEVYGGTLKTKSYAGYGQIEYKLSDLLTVIGGLRYSDDTKTYNFQHAENGVVDLVFNKATVGKLASNKSNQWSWKAQVNATPSDDVLVYAGVNRGTKSGSFGTPAFYIEDLSTIPFKPETLTSYEAGLKITMLGGKAHFNAAAFHYDYKNYQAFELVGLSLAIRNKQARINGLEASFDVRPVTGLSISTFATLLDTKVKNVVLPGGQVADTKMPQAPDFSAGFAVSYGFYAGPGYLKLATDWKYDSSQYFSTFNAPVDRQPARFVGNAKVSYDIGDSGVEIAAFVNNVTDKEYRLYNLDLSGPLGLTQQTYARPRWFGASVTYRIGA